jgi:hypothetical protein
VIDDAGAFTLGSVLVSVLETILYFVVPSVGIYALIALLVARRRLSGRQRYRVGQPWPYEPLYWTANPDGAHLSAADHHVAIGGRVGAERGGARGSW